jgi:hypothetical protein
MARSLTTDFDSLQASVHLLDDGKNELIRLSHAGLESVAPPQRIPLGEGFLGNVAVELSAQDMTTVDLEPQTQVCVEVQGMAMLCPLAAGRQFLGLVHVVLPGNLAKDYLYTRVPMTLAHHLALAFYTARLTGSGS